MTTLNDVNLDDKKVTAYSATEAGLAKVREDFSADKVPKEVTEGNYEFVKEAATTLQKLRTALDKKRKAVKAPYKEACDLIDGEARRITAEIVTLEDPWKDAKKEYDDREKRRKEELEAKIEGVFTRINAYVEQAYTAESSADVSNIIDECRNEDCTDAYARAKEALELRNRTLERLQEIYGQRVDAEAESKRRAQLEAEQRQMRKEAAAREQIASLKGTMAELMDASKAELEKELEILSELYLDPGDFVGTLLAEAEEARTKAIAGVKKLIAMAPEEETPAVGKGADAAAQEAPATAEAAFIGIDHAAPGSDHIAEMVAPKRKMYHQINVSADCFSEVMNVLMDRFKVRAIRDEHTMQDEYYVE